MYLYSSNLLSLGGGPVQYIEVCWQQDNHQLNIVVQ